MVKFKTLIWDKVEPPKTVEIKAEYIDIGWVPKKQKDIEIIIELQSTRESRGEMSLDGDNITLFMKEIWKDSKNFDNFIKELCIIETTEMSCLVERNFAPSPFNGLCISHGNGNNCPHFITAKKIFNYNYFMIPDDYGKD